MRAHTRHLILAVLILALLAILATVAARAQDFSGYNGQRLYMRFCASCHGESGRGDGPVAKSLTVMVPDLTRIARRQGGVFPEEQVRRIVDGRTLRPPHGSRDTPRPTEVLRTQGRLDRTLAVDGTSRATQVLRECIQHIIE